MAHIHTEPEEISATTRESARGDETEGDSGVGELAGALRAAKRAYHEYVTELDQGDVEPAEDWSTWYAEYLLGVR